MTDSNKRILIVEDDVEQCDVFAEKINTIDSNIDVTKSYDPVEAVKQCERGRFNLIFTDFRMPELSGVKFIEAIKAIELQKDTPVVVVTGFINADATDRTLSAGASKVLRKPVRKDTIIESLELMN